MKYPGSAEWLETDGLGGFASGSADGIRRRRYHGLLVAALDPPGDRRSLVKGLELWLEGPGGRSDLSAQRYRGDVTHPRGDKALLDFGIEPWPTFRYAAAPDLTIIQEVCMVRGLPLVLIRVQAKGNAQNCTLHARPLMSGTDFHGLEHEDARVDLRPQFEAGFVSFALRDPHARVLLASNGRYMHAPDWYRAFLYEEERARGLDSEEDLASPGELSWSLNEPAVLVLAHDTPATRAAVDALQLRESVEALFDAERTRRAAFATGLHRAADAYLVRRGAGSTVIAGYPWFGDWGRDTFIALRGLGLATQRFDLVRDVLVAWADLVSQGMLPNRFADGADVPEFNAVDAALWYVVVAGELSARAPGLLSELDHGRITRAILAIVSGYGNGTRHGIRCDQDGLLAAGEPGFQLTWMDAKIGDWVVTPRVGKPVEIQALWIHALDLAATLDARWAAQRDLALRSFSEKFWCEERGYLYDVIDVEHVPGRTDASLRPNQLLALGGLSRVLVPEDRVRRALAAIEGALLTPVGLRSLAPNDERYASHYAGGPRDRDAVYHQGTVWPWLIGPFVDAWLALHGQTAAHQREAYERFAKPLLAHLDTAGLGHVSEVADGDAPHTPGGCPFQAWSVGELLRLVERLGVGQQPTDNFVPDARNDRPAAA
jgi:predicted glycogen debranching enzyme